ncbi:hypothetical protein AND_008640 [Anopheles darlingi]|uniref:inositol-polyphosphate 5-phosphatase n=1 Tax=Anopheles darlingi TaxID=43151 RepID=W5J5M7_ANODA|nr:hypothetical protein AND_008640 [Anopheles darlingi]
MTGEIVLPLSPSNLLHLWVREFLNHVSQCRPIFIALHLQEVGGKTYEKSMDYVQEFIANLCESEELKDYNRIRVYLDEDYNSAEHFTALGNLYFVQSTVKHVLMWNFLTHEWDLVEGKSIYTGSIETVASKEKAKFPQQFFPEKLTEDLTMHRIQNAASKPDSTKVQYRDSDGVNVLTVGKKEFSHCDQSTFKEQWLRQFDRELDSLRSVLYEYPITFPPSYPYEEDPLQPGAYMTTRCPAWCDRILISPAARKLICGGVDNTMPKHDANYGVIGSDVCMGDHKQILEQSGTEPSDKHYCQFLDQPDVLKSEENEPQHPAVSISVYDTDNNLNPAKHAKLAHIREDIVPPSILNDTTCEITAEELLDRLQQYTDLNTRICEQQQKIEASSGQMINSRYVQILPTGSDVGDDDTITTPETVSGTAGEEDGSYYGEATGPRCALIFRETSV